jgi:hypothetical protein
VMFTDDSLSRQRNKTRKKLATQIGLYVPSPSDVFEKAKSDFEAIRARIGEDLWHKLNQNYPKMRSLQFVDFAQSFPMFESPPYEYSADFPYT